MVLQELHDAALWGHFGVDKLMMRFYYGFGGLA